MLLYHSVLKHVTGKYVLVISGLRGEAEENDTLLGSYAVSSGTSLPTFRDKN